MIMVLELARALQRVHRITQQIIDRPARRGSSSRPPLVGVGQARRLRKYRRLVAYIRLIEGRSLSDCYLPVMNMVSRVVIAADITLRCRDALHARGFAETLLPEACPRAWPEDWWSAEGPRLLRKIGQLSGAPLSGDIEAFSTAYRSRTPRTECEADDLRISTRDVWFEDP